jgi:hypothetical protein
MLFTNHLLAGALIGRYARDPAVAFVAGAASHIAMDVVPHWGAWDDAGLLRVARVDGLLALAVAARAVRSAPPHRRLAVVAGMVGAGVLDLDKPGRHFLGASPFPAAVDAWHAEIQRGREARGRWWVEAIGALALASAVHRRDRRLRPSAPA